MREVLQFSYFEWLKNLSHVHFGRMEKRFEEKTFSNLLSVIESVSGKKFSEQERRAAAHGADEQDLVYSGLEETMACSYQQIREVHKRLGNSTDLRTASFVDAIDKIACCYGDMGIFP